MGPCPYCAPIPMPGYESMPYKPTPAPIPTVQLTLNIEAKLVESMLRAELARLLRKFAELESGPVGIRLKQIAEVFDGSC